MSAGRRRPVARRALAGLAVALVALGLGEAAFRVWPPPTVGEVPAAQAGDATLMNGNPWLLWELIPGDHLERGGHVHVNAAGFRDRDRGPKQRPRALALGDSSVYGFGNDDDDVFTSRLEAALDADFVNGAVPGYSSYQALNLLQGRGLALDPDLLLVATLWSDNNFDSFRDVELLADYAGWSHTPGARLRAALAGSALFRGLDWHLRVRPTAAAAAKVGWQVGGTDGRTGTRRVALADYARNLRTFCEIMAARGGGVVFVVLPNREDLAPVSPDPAWAPYRDVMRATAEACAAPLVEGPAAFRAAGKSADALFLDVMHPTPAGHAVLAEAVAATLRAARWPAAPLRAVAPAPVPVPVDRFEGHGGLAEAAGMRPESLELRLTVPRVAAGMVVDVRDAAHPDAGALGSAPIAAADASDGDVRVVVQLSRRPPEVVLGLTGPGVRVLSPPLALTGATLQARLDGE